MDDAIKTYYLDRTLEHPSVLVCVLLLTDCCCVITL
jgi:hypothetical protein